MYGVEQSHVDRYVYLYLVSGFEHGNHEVSALRINEGEKKRVTMVGWRFHRAASIRANVGTDCVCLSVGLVPHFGDFRVRTWETFYGGWIPSKGGGKKGDLFLVGDALQGVWKCMIEYKVLFVEAFRLLSERLWW